MNTKIKIQKLGNHWYPAINHDDFQEIVLDSKIERYFSLIDVNNIGTLSITIEKCNNVTDNTLFFRDEDITRYFITNDDFDLTCYITNHPFKINSKLYCLLEREYDFSFHELLYNITITAEI